MHHSRLSADIGSRPRRHRSNLSPETLPTRDVVVVTGAADSAEVAGVSLVTLEDTSEFADLVFLHRALDTGTRGLIDGRRLVLLRPTSFLIDTARVGLLDQSATALRRAAILNAPERVREQDHTEDSSR